MSEQQKPIAMPKFDFSSCSIKTDAELEEQLKKAGSQDRHFRPGKHDVVIDKVEFKGLAEKDPNWGKLEVTLRGTGEKTTRDTVMIPFKDVTYGAKKVLYPFKKLSQFCSSLGVELKVENLKSVMQSTFAKPEKLVGKPLSVVVAYTKAHAEWAGKDGEGNSQYKLVLGDGNTYCGADGKPLLFPDYAAVAAFAKEQKIDYNGFCNVTEYCPSTAKAANEDNW